MRHDIKASTTAAILLGVATALASACSSETRSVVMGRETEPPSFTTSDAGDASSGEASAPEVPMCPVTTCTAPWVSCATSKFPCDVNVLYDDSNCGECGVRCPGAGGKQDNWSCIAGKCVHSCQDGWGDCDGDPTNGCEEFLVSDTRDATNCGECGHTCPAGLICSNSTCMNFCARPQAAGRPDSCGPFTCVNLEVDDRNCGSCGVVCDRTGPDLPPLPSDIYYGCAGRACGKRKCAIANRADCNGDPGDGCETSLHTADDCNGCDDKCAPGKTCMLRDGNWGCQCGDGETLCTSGCVTLGDDPMNCGGCNNVCPGRLLPHFEPTCSDGVCAGACAQGYVDCDGLRDNGCETDTRVDNRHCGGCGRACLPDQVCSGGTCLVAPCDGGGTTQ